MRNKLLMKNDHFTYAFHVLIYFYFFHTGHLLFQGVSHALYYSCIILFPALVLLAIHFVSWPLSNQSLCEPS